MCGSFQREKIAESYGYSNVDNDFYYLEDKQ